MKPQPPIYEALLRWRRSDQEGYKRFVAAFEDVYLKRLADFVKGKAEDLPKFQGAALAYQDLLELFNQVLTAS